MNAIVKFGAKEGLTVFSFFEYFASVCADGNRTRNSRRDPGPTTCDKKGKFGVPVHCEKL